MTTPTCLSPATSLNSLSRPHNCNVRDWRESHKTQFLTSQNSPPKKNLSTRSSPFRTTALTVLPIHSSYDAGKRFGDVSSTYSCQDTFPFFETFCMRDRHALSQCKPRLAINAWTPLRLCRRLCHGQMRDKNLQNAIGTGPSRIKHVSVPSPCTQPCHSFATF